MQLTFIFLEPFKHTLVSTHILYIFLNMILCFSLLPHLKFPHMTSLLLLLLSYRLLLELPKPPPFSQAQTLAHLLFESSLSQAPARPVLVNPSSNILFSSNQAQASMYIFRTKLDCVPSNTSCTDHDCGIS